MIMTCAPTHSWAGCDNIEVSFGAMVSPGLAGMHMEADKVTN